MGREQLNRDPGRPRRVLAVADWSIDPSAVAEALRAENDREPTVFSLLVPSRLRALDWIGDPNASQPCAERQLTAVEAEARARGLQIERAGVGDPERVSAIRAFLEGWAADQVLLYEHERRDDANPFSVYHRLARKMGDAVRRVAVPPARSARGHGWPRRAPRCVAPVA